MYTSFFSIHFKKEEDDCEAFELVLAQSELHLCLKRVLDKFIA